MTKPSPELVAETVRFCRAALERKAIELEQAAQGAESPAQALAAISRCLVTDSLLTLAQDALRVVAGGGAIHPEAIAEALDGFGAEADPLRALLAEHEAAAAE